MKILPTDSSISCLQVIIEYLHCLSQTISIKNYQSKISNFKCDILCLVCQKQTQLDLNQTYVIQSPEFPLSYHAGMRCSWNITKSTQNTWFKMSSLELGNNCLTSFQMDFKDELCSKTRENKSLIVTDDSVFLTFSSLRPGKPSSLLVEGKTRIYLFLIKNTSVKKSSELAIVYNSYAEKKNLGKMI